jgi:hypothetical protein
LKIDRLDPCVDFVEAMAKRTSSFEPLRLMEGVLLLRKDKREWKRRHFLLTQAALSFTRIGEVSLVGHTAEAERG